MNYFASSTNVKFANCDTSSYGTVNRNMNKIIRFYEAGRCVYGYNYNYKKAVVGKIIKFQL